MTEPGNILKNYYRTEILDQPQIDTPLFSYEDVERSLRGWLAEQGLVAREVWFGRPTHYTDHDTGYFAWESGGEGSEEFPTHVMELADEQVQKSNRPDEDRADFCLVLASKPEDPFSLLTVLRFVDYPEISSADIASALAAVSAMRSDGQP